MSTTTTTTTTTSSFPWPVRPYQPRHQAWPYTATDFARQDPASDTHFYSTPRLVTHIDDAAIEDLARYYDAVLPRTGCLLDFCSSWTSHYPRSIAEAAQKGDLHVIGMGMNQAELDANPVLRDSEGSGKSRRLVADLNADPDMHKALLPSLQQVNTKPIDDQSGHDGDDEQHLLNASTCVVSIDYLTRPLEVLQSLRSATRPGGTVHLVISNRCFPTKVVGRWLRVSEDERLQMVGDYLHFSGWKEIEIVELSDGQRRVAQGEDGSMSSSSSASSSGLASLMRFVGVGLSRDPLWVVRAVNR